MKYFPLFHPSSIGGSASLLTAESFLRCLTALETHPSSRWKRQLRRSIPRSAMQVYVPPAGGTQYGSHPRKPSEALLGLFLSTFLAITSCLINAPVSRPSARKVALLSILAALLFFFQFLPICTLCLNIAGIVFRCIRRDVRYRPNKKLIDDLLDIRGIIEARQDAFSSLPFHSLGWAPGDQTNESQPIFSLSFIKKCIILLVVIVLSQMQWDIYLRRLHITYHGATYVALLGFDHRSGWLAINAHVTSSVALLVHLLNIRWDFQPAVFLHPTEDKQVTMWLGLVVAAIVQDVLGKATNHSSVLHGIATMIISASCWPKSIILCLICCVLMLITGRNYVPKRTGIIATAAVGLTLLVFVGASQLSIDTMELKDVITGRYYPWNYRWAVNVRYRSPWPGFG